MPFINRELSWLEFNQRVLSEAQNESLPLLERLKFLAITASNLDEFFQVRVGGLHLMRTSGSTKRGITGMTPYQQLVKIRARSTKMYQEQYALLNEILFPALEDAGIHFLDDEKDLSPIQKDALAKRFTDGVLPLLTPLAYDPDFPMPALPAMQIVIACELRSDEDKSIRHVFIPLPEQIQRFVHLPKSDATDSRETFINLESVLAIHCGQLFPEETVTATMPFRITRNGDIAVQEEDAIDLAGEMEEVLAARKTSNTVRLELPATKAPVRLKKLVREITEATVKEIYPVAGPHALTDFMSLVFLPGFDHLRDEPWEAQPSNSFDPGASIFETLAEQDVLLYHPYESFEPVLRFIEEAASDPETIAIKQVLYRTASSSRIVDALIKAAEAGKQVTVLIELKARFDEARNLLRADELQRAGVQIVYGVKGLKTHSKIALVIRNEDGLLKRYVHLGTGNYNESTARLYTDVSYLTSLPAYGEDASLFFNAVTGRSRLTRFAKLIPAPTHMKPRLLELIAAEEKRAKRGEPAYITAKINSLQDKEMIEALYAASRQGVKIRLNIRGICCLKTGKRKESKNIQVVSVIDRYLEHARIFSFHNGGRPLVFISSADWMTRNLDKRVELMIPIEDTRSKKRLIEILEAAFKDNCNAHNIVEDGSSQRIERGKNRKRFRMQEHLQRQAKRAAKAKAHERSTTFEPHVPSDETS